MLIAMSIIQRAKYFRIHKKVLAVLEKEKKDVQTKGSFKKKNSKNKSKKQKQNKSLNK